MAIASNESFSGWTKTFTDPRFCAAIIDRLAFGGDIIDTGTYSLPTRHHARPARRATGLWRLITAILLWWRDRAPLTHRMAYPSHRGPPDLSGTAATTSAKTFASPTIAARQLRTTRGGPRGRPQPAAATTTCRRRASAR